MRTRIIIVCLALLAMGCASKVKRCNYERNHTTLVPSQLYAYSFTLQMIELQSRADAEYSTCMGKS